MNRFLTNRGHIENYNFTLIRLELVELVIFWVLNCIVTNKGFKEMITHTRTATILSVWWNKNSVKFKIFHNKKIGEKYATVIHFEIQYYWIFLWFNAKCIGLINFNFNQ